MIPDKWKVKEFEEVAHIANGQVSPLSEPYIDYYHIGPDNIDSGTGRIENIQVVRDLGLTSGKYIFDEKSIVYSKIRPNLNKVCMPDFVGICSADMYPLWPKGDMIREYLYQFMRSSFFLKQTIAVSMRTGLPKINRDDLKQIEVLVPPEDEQRTIANILATWDRGIDLITQLIVLKQQRKRGLMQQLLTGKRRFRGFTDKAWTKKQIGDLFLERAETGRSNLPLLAITNKGGIVSRDSLERRDTSNEDKSKYLRICKGDIGYNTMRMWQGVSAVSDMEGIVSPAYTICVPLENVDANFMGHLFKSPQMIHLFRRYSQGLVDDTLSLKFDVFSKIEVTVPALDEQKRIAEVFDTCNSELALLNRKLALLKKQKQGLMQQLLTGKVRVKT
ncbi:MAG: restriction endonuclease subunit S [Ktedonobacteraceae bacterium]|nr:restriction endonuclease subunit S [Ktedonobacteraceae bacterium]